MTSEAACPPHGLPGRCTPSAPTSAPSVDARCAVCGVRCAAPPKAFSQRSVAKALANVAESRCIPESRCVGEAATGLAILDFRCAGVARATMLHGPNQHKTACLSLQFYKFTTAGDSQLNP